MQKIKDIYQFDSLRKGVIVCLKITLILGAFFALVFQQTTLHGILMSFGITAMYSFGLGLGNGFLNKLLSSKWNWVTQTNQRVIAGIIGTIIYTIVIVLIIDYVQLVIINNQDVSLFFSERMNWMHLFNIILSLGVATFLHARDFMINWKASLKQETTVQKIIAGTA